MSKTLREFEYRPPWTFILAPACIALVLTVNGVVLVVPYYWAKSLSPGVWGIVPFIALFLLGTFWLFLVFVTLRMIICRFKPSQRIVLTEDGLVMPRLVGLSAEVSLPYADITRARHAFSRWSRSIQLTSKHGCFDIVSGGLSKRSDFDEILGILSERMAAAGATLESHERWFAGRWTRPQFSVRFMLILTAIVAGLLGVRLYSDRPLGWGDILVVGYVPLLLAIPFLALLPGRKWGIAFTVGYCGGMIADWAALAFLIRHDLLQFVPGTFTSAGWFPSSLPIERLLANGAHVDAPDATFAATLAGPVVSGVLTGTVAATAWLLAARIRRKPSSDSTEHTAAEADRLRTDS